VNNYPVTVVNDFYDNPDEIRNYALSQKFTYCHEMKDIDYVFPGSRTKDLLSISPSLYEKVCKRLMSVFHIPEYDLLRFQIATSFQLVEAKYGRGLIHQDHQTTIFAGVLYLTPNAPLSGGTSIYIKNKKYSEEAYWKAHDENDQRFRTNQPQDFTLHEMFDEVVRVNNVYNTLILFEGNQYHSANEFFGQDKFNSRLCQVFFVNRVEANNPNSFPIRRMRNQKIGRQN